MSFKKTTKQEVVEKQVTIKEIIERETLEVVLDGTDSISSEDANRIKTAAEALVTAFSWANTKEGSEFWEYTYDRLKELSRVPPKK